MLLGATGLLHQALATVTIWALSAVLALSLAVALAVGSSGTRTALRLLAHGAITVTRGVPTSLLVVGAGILALGRPSPAWLPDPFPGTPPELALVAWAVTAALALGSTGHLAVIFRTGYQSLGPARLEQATVLGLGPLRRLGLLAREAAAATLAPTGTRLVHHLHNTAFAALFPVAELFGWVQEGANTTFDIGRYTTAGIGAYVLLSLLIWALCRGVEHLLGAPARRQPAVVPA